MLSVTLLETSHVKFLSLNNAFLGGIISAKSAARVDVDILRGFSITKIN